MVLVVFTGIQSSFIPAVG